MTREQLAWLALGYVAIGAVSALACAIAGRLAAVADGVACAALWPMYLPLVLARGAGDDDLATDDGERALLVAIARARSSPLGALLPDPDTTRALARRVRETRARLGELEGLLARPDFDPTRAAIRARELAQLGPGSSAAATSASLRVRTLTQLAALRARCRAELDDVSELVAQLHAQAELVRLDPTAATRQTSAELVRELVARLEGLGDALADDDAREYAGAAERSA